MRTSELNKGQPILTFLAPSGANTASLGQPTKCSFHNPTTCRMLLALWNRFGQWFASSALVSNMFLITSLRNKKMHIIEIVPFIQTEMLFFSWTGDDNGKDKVVDRPFIVLIRARNMNGQRRATFINQDMNLGPAFAAVGGIVPRCFSTQRGGYRFAVDSLPFPANPSLPIVETNQGLQDFVPNALLLPSLEPLMQNTAGNTEPIAMDCFPLATCPQNVPEAIDNRPIVNPWTPWPTLLKRFGQMLFDSTPQWARDTEIVDILGLLFILAFQDAPRWTFVFGQTDCPRGASFV